ncbi:hypothetical protein GEI7407_2067 [Geitlerinema sp. PCC 7407]|nr:hypothetical protein GEI7407_2067 [Geitlerinema sp. PCC 7407]
MRKNSTGNGEAGGWRMNFRWQSGEGIPKTWVVADNPNDYEKDGTPRR